MGCSSDSSAQLCCGSSKAAIVYRTGNGLVWPKGLTLFAPPSDNKFCRFCRMAMEGFTEELGHEHGFEEAPGFD